MSLSILFERVGKLSLSSHCKPPSTGSGQASAMLWWFTEGFDTKDLQEAKVLLDRLA
jgi:hypothetical protein